MSRGSNHPSIVLDNIPYGINKRLSCISSNAECFNEDIHVYQKALTDAGYNYKFSYEKGFERRQRQYCGRGHNPDPSNTHVDRNQVIWFNPPWNLYSATNVGKLFRDIIQKHFSGGNDLSRLFNKNKLKISYSCLQNIGSKISSHMSM